MFDLDEYSSSILPWLKSLQDPSNPGHFKLCKRGATLSPSHNKGLGISCLALKIAYTINAIDQFTSHQMEQWADYIRSFQIGEHRRFSSFFEDKGLVNSVDGLKLGPVYLGGPFKFIKNIAVRRAETRQACASLLCIGKRAKYPVKSIPDNADEALKYFHSLNWKQAWVAGSHFSHLIFLLKYNADNFGRRQAYEDITPILWNELDKLLDKKTGCWFKGNCADFQKINGAMKVFTAYSIVKRPPSHPEKLIDFCLAASHDNDGCGVLDILHVIHYCAKYSNHRKGEVKQFAEQQLGEILKFRKKDGAFSFYPDKSQIKYYGQKVSRGLCESDIHGTHLFTWTLCLIAEILEDFNKISWNIPVT